MVFERFGKESVYKALAGAQRKIEGISHENQARALGFAVAACGAYLVRGIASGDVTEMVIGGVIETGFTHKMIVQLAQAARKDDWKSWKR